MREVDLGILTSVKNFFTSDFIRDRRMIAQYFSKVPKEAVKVGMYATLAGIVGLKVFPVLRQWEVFASFPSDAYMEREVCQ